MGPGAPDAYFATVPAKAMAAAIRAAGVDASVSYSAGTFVCNHVFFGLCHMARTRHPAMRCGFIHVPWTPAQAAEAARAPGEATPTLASDVVAGGLAAAVAVIGSADPDGISEGRLW